MKSILLSVSLLVIITLCSFIPVVEVAKQGRRSRETSSFWPYTFSGNTESSDDENINLKKQQILDQLLNPEVYDKRVRPKGSGPTNITISIFVMNIIDMDQYLKDFTMQCYFRQKWKDPRLQYEKEAPNIRKIRSTETNNVWKPDLFFNNEIKGEFHDLMVPNQLLHIKPDGEVLLSNKVSVILSCLTDLMFYPHDEQICYMNIESYGLTFEELALQWDGEKAVGVSTELSSDSKYILLNHKLKFRHVTINDSVYEVLNLEMHFSRNFHAFLISVYLPHILLVILSWASFCFDHKKVTLRLIYLGLILFLIIRLIPTDRDPDLQITALDIWISVCVMFILFCFLESIFVHQAANEEDAEVAKHRDAEQQLSNSGHMNEEKVEKKSDITKENKILARLTRKYPAHSKRVDVICRVVSPVLFLLFNIMYWSVCCSASKYD